MLRTKTIFVEINITIMKTKLTLFALITFALIGCNSAKVEKTEKSSNEITEKYWKLKTLDGKDITMQDNQEREIFITLKAEGNKIVGFAGCNSLSGEYTLEEGNRIRFSNIAVTMRACPDVKVNESEFLEVFELADNYTINNDVLSLNVGRRAPLAVFEAVYMK